MPGNAKRILGVDTALRRTGVAVVESAGGRLAVVESATVRNGRERRVSECLVHLHDAISEIIARLQPEAAVLEGVFFARNVRTSVSLGEARGAVITACGRAGVPIYEYSPRRVKQAVVGCGGAEKRQVQKMVMSMLGLPGMPKEDEADAMALAICHLHSRTAYAELAPEEI